jgi:hypothetical protein
MSYLTFAIFWELAALTPADVIRQIWPILILKYQYYDSQTPEVKNKSNS